VIIKVLGSGCMNCQKLEKRTKEAVEKLGIDAEVLKVQELADIMAYGIMSTPALVIDEDVKLAGRVPSADDIAAIIQAAG